MNSTSKLAQAVQNNSRWCDVICRAHGVPGEFHEAYWVNHGKVPPYTPNLIAFAGVERADVVHAAICSLTASGPETHFTIKDAFRCLDLASLGFRVLFHASWIYWDPATTAPVGRGEALEWSVVQARDELTDWECAWRGGPANNGMGQSPRVFPPSLLEQPGLHFLAGKRAGTLVATGALNWTGDVVGLSNVFTAVPDIDPLFPGCLCLAQALYPRDPHCGLRARW